MDNPFLKLLEDFSISINFEQNSYFFNFDFHWKWQIIWKRIQFWALFKNTILFPKFLLHYSMIFKIDWGFLFLICRRLKHMYIYLISLFELQDWNVSSRRSKMNQTTIFCEEDEFRYYNLENKIKHISMCFDCLLMGKKTPQSILKIDEQWRRNLGNEIVFVNNAKNIFFQIISHFWTKTQV